MALKAKYVVFDDSPPHLSIVDSILPELEEGELLVKVLFTALCRSDINTYVGKRKEKTPTILGHESVGIIYKIGSNDDLFDARGEKLSIGERITWAIYSSDPSDPMSIKGIPQKAGYLFKYGHEEITETSNFHGGLSEYIVLRKNTPVVLLPPSLTNEVASLVNCSIATVAAALRLVGKISSKNIMVTGAGMLGLFACSMLAHHKAASVIAVDISRLRLDIAREYGADQTFLFSDLQKCKLKPDVVIDFSGANEAMQLAVDLVNVGGTIIWVGATFPQEDLSISAEKLIRKIITIKGIHNYNQHDLVTAVDFISSKTVASQFSKFIEKSFPLENTQEAFDYAVENNPYRVGIFFNK